MKLPEENKRVEQVIKYTCDGNQLRFSKEIGISQPRINRLFKPDNRSGKYPLVSFEIAQAIINKYIMISPGWLVSGRGEMIKPNVQENVINENDNIIDNIFDTKPNVQKEDVMIERNTPVKTGVYGQKISNLFKLRTDVLQAHQIIPVYGFEATAGVVSIFADLNRTDPIDYLDVPRAPRCDGAIFAAGDSMYPLIKSGDILGFKFIDPKEDIFFGEMYIIAIQQDDEEMITVKFVQRSDKGEKYIKLVSHNQHHQDKDIPLTRVSTMALVKLTLRYNSMH